MVFGDTLSNYVSGDDGYIVANARVAASTSTKVPEPTTLLLLGLGLAGTVVQKQKKQLVRRNTERIKKIIYYYIRLCDEVYFFK